MNRAIDRTLFIFDDEGERLVYIGNRYFPLAIMFDRLMNEVYDGKKIVYINIFFGTDKVYASHPAVHKGLVHYYGGHLAYYAEFDVNMFNAIKEDEQDKLIWEKVHASLEVAARSIKNNALLKACDYAYKKGLEVNLNPDYKVLESDISIYGYQVKAAVWINFFRDYMSSKFTLERNGKVIFEKPIDKAVPGNEFFLEMYKGIQVKDDMVIIKGHRDVEYLPLKILIPEGVLTAH